MKTQYLVSARKYRPDSFASMVGQEALTATLKNAILQDKTAHAYLFCGPRGVGKTSCARVFAKTINCMNRGSDGEACGSCESCLAFEEQRSMNIYELDAASNNSVDDIRQLIEQVVLPPQIGRYKIYIIDEVHMLSQGAFNAFLKTLEEPPEYVIFILATTEKHKILPTILSRCQIYDFKRIGVASILNHLQYVAQAEGVEAEERALNVIALKADGGMRDALSLFDRMASFGEGRVTYAATIENLNILDHEYYFRVISYVLQGDYRSVLLIYDELLQKGFDGQVFVNGLAAFLRDLLMAQHPATLPLLEQPESIRQRYGELAQQCPDTLLIESLQRLNACDQQYRQSNGKRLLVELTLMAIAADFMRLKGQTARPNPPTTAAANTETKQAQAKQFAAPQTQPKTETSVTPPAASKLADSPAQNYQKSSTETAAVVKDDPKAVPSPSPKQRLSETSTTVQHKPTTPAREAAKPTTELSDYAQLLGGVSLKRIGKRKTDTNQSEEGGEEEPSEEPLLANPFTEEELQKAWLGYVENELSDQVYLKQFMSNSLPVMDADGQTMRVTLLNSNQVETLEEHRQSLLPYLREQLSNQKIQMQIVVDASESKKLPSASREKVEYLKKENPQLEQFIEQLDLRF